MLSPRISHRWLITQCDGGCSGGGGFRDCPGKAIAKAGPIKAAFGGAPTRQGRWRQISTTAPELSLPDSKVPILFSAELTIRAASSSRPRPVLDILRPLQPLLDNVASHSLPLRSTTSTQTSQDLATRLTHNGRPRAGADSLRGRLGANLQTSEALSSAP